MPHKEKRPYVDKMAHGVFVGKKKLSAKAKKKKREHYILIFLTARGNRIEMRVVLVCMCLMRERAEINQL